MPHLNEYDALTGTNKTVNLTTKEVAIMREGDTNILLIDRIAARAQSKAALLERLGITADEAALLLS